ncbi:MAG: pyridoxamine 5'-phosphate oxidase family protein [Sedimenticola sp.]|nr:pyridoxamine 5'-phosphate oxidase family protein [Sedimenticola sp.]
MSTSSTWHPGEIEAQMRAGSHDRMQAIGSRAIHPTLSDQQCHFFSQLPLVMAAAEDTSGRLWATALSGRPGFIHAPDPTTLIVNSGPIPLDPLADALVPGSEIALLGIDFSNRRRNRVNATITAATHQHLELSIKQAFGNCPKYIQIRQRKQHPNPGVSAATHFSGIDTALAGFLQRSDTCFIASLFRDNDRKANRGVDISHRGGRPGFVVVADEQTLLIPDYAGNNYFNTVGNLMRDPRAALLFFNFSRGHLVHLSGECEVVWREDEAIPFDNVQRMLRFRLQRGRVVRNGLPFSYGPADFSPFNPPVGV